MNRHPSGWANICHEMALRKNYGLRHALCSSRAITGRLGMSKILHKYLQIRHLQRRTGLPVCYSMGMSINHITQHDKQALTAKSFQDLVQRTLLPVATYRKRVFTLLLWSMIVSPFRKCVQQMYLNSRGLSLSAGITLRQWYGLLGSPKLPWDQIWQNVVAYLQTLGMLQSDGRITLALDDSLCPKTGKKISHAQSHFDHASKLNSSNYIWGHCRVVVGLLGKIHQRWAFLPLAQAPFIRFRPECTKLDIAETLIRRLYRWTRSPMLVVCDSWYGVYRLIHAAEQFSDNNIHFISRLRSNCTIYDLPSAEEKPRRGRPRKYGNQLPQVLEHAQSLPLKSDRIFKYGKMRECSYCEFNAVSKALKRTIKIVCIQQSNGGFFPIYSTDLNISASRMIELYSARWKIEAAFRELKQEGGALDNQARKENCVENHFQMCCLSMTLMWIYAAIQDRAPSRCNPGISSEAFSVNDIRDQIRREVAQDANFSGFCSDTLKLAGNYILSKLLGVAA